MWPNLNAAKVGPHPTTGYQPNPYEKSRCCLTNKHWIFINSDNDRSLALLISSSNSTKQKLCCTSWDVCMPTSVLQKFDEWRNSSCKHVLFCFLKKIELDPLNDNLLWHDNLTQSSQHQYYTWRRDQSTAFHKLKAIQFLQSHKRQFIYTQMIFFWSELSKLFAKISLNIIKIWISPYS